MLFNEKYFNDKFSFNLFDVISYQNFITLHVKTVKNFSFIIDLSSKFQVIFKKSQTPGFSKTFLLNI